MNIQIQSSGFDADNKLVEFINSKSEKITKFHDKIIDLEIHLSLESHLKVKDKVARLVCNIPNHKLFAESTSKTFEAAVSETVDDMIRQLKKHKDRATDKNQKEKAAFKREM